MGPFVSREYPDEMLQRAAFHQALHCLFCCGEKNFQEQKYSKLFDPLMWIISHSRFMLSNKMEGF